MTPTEIKTRFAALEKEVASLKEQLQYGQTIAGIKRGLDDARRGLGIPLKQADEQLRSKYGIPRS